MEIKTKVIEQPYPYEKGGSGNLIEKIIIGQSRFEDYIVAKQETPTGVTRGSLMILKSKASEVALAISQNIETISSDNSKTFTNALDRIDKLEKQNKNLFEALEELVELKQIKDTKGKTFVYCDRQLRAWENARQILLINKNL